MRTHEIMSKQNCNSLGQFCEHLPFCCLVHCMTLTCLDNCLYAPGHTLYEVLTYFWCNSISLINQSIPQFMYSFGWSFEDFTVPHVFRACLRGQARTPSYSIVLRTDSQISNLADITLQKWLWPVCTDKHGLCSMSTSKYYLLVLIQTFVRASPC